ncbi:MAG: hypothetical protein QM530_05565 [Phycisphaerales bacterium]|nr:hypothetical protein [Phycisphaerales bacterium]
MPFSKLIAQIKTNRCQYFTIALILVGIGFRLLLFFQNRNLIIDEANVVRNIYERDYWALLKPLSYEQFAPPLFLWMLKLMSHLFGYSEFAMRFFPLICGISSLFIYRSLLQKILPINSLWLPLGLFCFAPILVKYSTEVKQYIPDALVAISLALFALKININNYSKFRFLTVWIVLGSISIWASQPSVFILFSVGLYYFIQCVQEKKRDGIFILIPIGLVWFTQFALYYLLILKSQINSVYLQSYHGPYFLFAVPHSAAEWRHNWLRFREIIYNTGGYNIVSLYLCALLMAVGATSLLRKSLTLFALFVVPIILVMIAAALHQFSLIDRVIIFILPFTMIIVGFGLAQIIAWSNLYVRAAIIAGGLYMISLYNFGSLLYRPFQFHELTKGFDYVLSNHGSGKELYVDCSSKDTYIYYTQIHPHRAKYASLKNAYLFNWNDDNFEQVASNIKTTKAYFIFTGGAQELRNSHLRAVNKMLLATDSFKHAACFVYSFKSRVKFVQ